jgi:hypothetical protein
MLYNKEKRKVGIAMKLVENQIFDQERALYGSVGITVKDCRFDGPADGESAFKECRDIDVQDCYFNLRYPFWHDHALTINDSEMTPLCRAALWYSDAITVNDSRLHGIKALRECAAITLNHCDVRSAEFGWFCNQITLNDCSLEGEYVFLRCRDLTANRLRLNGKYSFQYLENATFSDCELKTKDSFWHAKNVTVENSTLDGEYLAWYSENLTLINCKIRGTQPFCYCKNLRLVNCELLDADLSFEKSTVDATVTTPVLSIKNPTAGKIVLPSVGEIILTDPAAKAEILCTEKQS